MRLKSFYGVLAVIILSFSGLKPALSQAGFKTGSPIDELPEYITQITHFGQRPEFSHDGKRIMFMERAYGDVFELELETGKITALTHHFPHEGFTRAFYLSNRDILLVGARTFDAKNPLPSRTRNAELWVMDKSLENPPVPLGVKCWEGPAVSRNELLVAYTKNFWQYPDRYGLYESQIFMAPIVYVNRRPKLGEEKLLVDSRELGIGNLARVLIEPQNFRPPDNLSLTFSIYYHYREGENPPDTNDHHGFVMEVEIGTGKLIQHTDLPVTHDEPEAIFPDGQYTLFESDRSNGLGEQYVDIWKLALDGSGEAERLTYFTEYEGYKSSDPVISPDGRFMAFQWAKIGDPPGAGRGILLFDFRKY